MSEPAHSSIGEKARVERRLLELARERRVAADAGGVPNHIEANRGGQAAYKDAADIVHAGFSEEEQGRVATCPVAQARPLRARRRSRPGAGRQPLRLQWGRGLMAREAQVVRNRRVGKLHIPTDGSLTGALCGIEPWSAGAFSHRGDRAEFERLCPERICKHCRNREVANAQ